jgi:hypothetical protein
MVAGVLILVLAYFLDHALHGQDVESDQHDGV